MKIKSFFLLTVLLLSTLACGLIGNPTNNPAVDLPVSATAPLVVVDSTSTPIPTFTPIATFTPAPPTEPPATPMLSQLLHVVSIPFNESGNAPVYTITAQIPSLEGAGDPRVANINTLLNQIVHDEINRFKTDVLASASNPPIAAGSSFDMQYTVLGQRGDIWSFKFDISYYADGAAHPGHSSRTLNFDLQNIRVLTLNELFLAGSSYLQTVSDYCKTQLSARDISFDMFSGGADALAGNYQGWNLTNDGLMITFDEYQVAPYAAGPQIVTVPYSELQNVMDLQSAIRWFAQ